MIEIRKVFRSRETEQVTTPRGQIIVNRTNFLELMKQRRWRNLADVGRALGYTRQNIALIMAGGVVSMEFMARLAITTGTWEDKTYTHYFEVVPIPQADNHQRWNHEKANGRMPYEAHSISAEFRSQDNPGEKRQYKLF